MAFKRSGVRFSYAPQQRHRCCSDAFFVGANSSNPLSLRDIPLPGGMRSPLRSDRCLRCFDFLTKVSLTLRHAPDGASALRASYSLRSTDSNPPPLPPHRQQSASGSLGPGCSYSVIIWTSRSKKGRFCSYPVPPVDPQEHFGYHLRTKNLFP